MLSLILLILGFASLFLTFKVLSNKNHENVAVKKDSYTDVNDTEGVVSNDTLLAQAKTGAIYKLKCSNSLFTIEEIELIENYGNWLSNLASGKLPPKTKEQLNFIDEWKFFTSLDSNEKLFFLSKLNDGDELQSAWFKYLMRLEIDKHT